MSYPQLSQPQGTAAVQMTQYGVQSPPTVITAQPVVTQPIVTTTVVTTQPQGLRPWSSNICDCFNDLKSCCCSAWCANYYYACVATRMGENCCIGCSGDDAGCIPGGHIAMRTKLRIKHNIQGDICDDCLVMHFCKPCAMCQMAREMNNLGYPSGAC